MKEKDVFKKILWLAITIIFIVLVVFYTDKIWLFFTWLMSQIRVVLLGIAIEFVLNIPTKFFEKIFTPKKKKENKDDKKEVEDSIKKEKRERRLAKGRRIISLLLSIMYQR